MLHDEHAWRDHSGPARTASEHVRAGRFSSAVTVCEDHLRRHRDDPSLLSTLASALLRLGRYEEARKASERALRRRPGEPRLLHQIGLAYARQSRFDEALRVLDRALERREGDPVLLGAKGDVLCTAGRYGEAFDLCSAAWERGRDPGLALALARAAMQTGRAPVAVGVLEDCLGSPAVVGRSRPDLLYALAEARDMLGEYDAAFEAVRTAAAESAPAHDPEAQSRGIDALIHAWSPDRIERLPRAARAERPVFIVGFWRSGTTLVEQILGCHPGVAAAGELLFLPTWAYEHRDWSASIAEPAVTDLEGLTPRLVRELSSGYLACLARTSPAAPRVTDKMPVNFMHLGLIWAAFPGARVVLCVRDPVDTCLSCLFNVRGSVAYAHDLYACGRFYRDAERLIGHWRSVLDLPILEVRYEDLVADQESQSRRLVEFLGLPWHDACLRPNENRRTAQTRSIDQVRRPVYRTSVGRASHYERHLGPLRQGLADGLERGTRGARGGASAGLDEALERVSRSDLN